MHVVHVCMCMHVCGGGAFVGPRLILGLCPIHQSRIPYWIRAQRFEVVASLLARPHTHFCHAKSATDRHLH